MSSIEDRLARDIAAVTRGVVVAESDLESAREAVEDRVNVRRLRDRRRRVFAATAAAAVAIPALGYGAFTAWDDSPRSDGETQPADHAPASADPVDDFLSGPPPTPSDLEGLWQVDEGTILVRFSAPDVVALDDTGRVLSDPAVTGTYAIEGDLLTIRIGQDSRNCAGQTFVMRSALPEAGSLLLAQTSAGEGSCNAEEHERWIVEQVLPTADTVADLTLSTDAGAGDWKSPGGPRALHGVWMAEGGGAVLELAPDGSYTVAGRSGEDADRGRWALDGSQLVLTSSAGSRSCSDGDKLVWEGLEQFVPDTTVMRGTLQLKGCPVPWASATWILLPDGVG